MQQCKRCILDEKYPGIHFDLDGTCNFCLSESSLSNIREEKVADRLSDFQKTIEDCRGKGRDYDCLVSLSGGKDSAYLAYLMKEKYDLRVLTFTIDMGFMSETALTNVNRIVTRLDVNHILYKPPESFYNKLFAYLFTNMSQSGAVPSVCYVCGPVTDGIILKEAVQRGIPLIVHGYGPNQPPDTRFFYEFPMSHLMGEGFVPGIFQNKLFTESDRNILWNYEKYKTVGELPRVLMPLHVLDYCEDEVIRKVEDLGLIAKRKASPMVTNCMLNWPMVYFQVKKLGYNPYIDFFSELIRTGKASRNKWLWLNRIVNLQIKLGIFKRKEIRTVLSRLGITEEDVIEREWIPSLTSSYEDEAPGTGAPNEHSL